MTKKIKLGKQVKQIIDDTSFREGRGDNDTVRLWENYREQALLWRGLALLQMLVTFTALVFAIYFYSNQEIKLNVPPKPLPGYYTAGEVQESEFINVATEFVNLIASYQYKVAERQFQNAANYLVEPILGKFEDEMLKTELSLVNQTQRTQLFFIDTSRTKIERIDNQTVNVSLIGERTRTVAGQHSYLPQIIQYTVSMTTVPKNVFNEYGIVISNLEVVKLER